MIRRTSVFLGRIAAEDLREVLHMHARAVCAAERTAELGRAHADWPLLRIKLTGVDDRERISALADAAPNSRILVDANGSWTLRDYERLIPILLESRVILVEQPFPQSLDDELISLERPIPVCADESSFDTVSLERIVRRYDVVNIKLEKTGGLTEALAMQRRARELGLKIMIGCMISPSLAMAPALLLASDAEFALVTGHTLIAQDRTLRLATRPGWVSPPEPALWG